MQIRIENESELVFGFNVKYFGVEFALIFIVEYGIVIFFCYIILFIFRNLLSFRIFIARLSIIMILVIYMRGIRYDELIYTYWEIILSLVLRYLFIVFRIKFLLVLFSN